MLDPEDDRLQGVSANKAYESLLKGKKSKTVTVAVIDSGIDIFSELNPSGHPVLAGMNWINQPEIIDNGQDEDNNCIVDDREGYDFFHTSC